MGLMRDLADRVLFPNRELHGIPVLDGAFSPNNRLDAAQPLGAPLPQPDDIAVDAQGRVYVSTADGIVRCSGPGLAQRERFGALSGRVGGLACGPRGEVLACVPGQGVVVLSAEGQALSVIVDAGGEQLRCPTSVAVAPDGTVFITDGSRDHEPGDWLPDLMKNLKPSGRLVAADAAGNARVLADGLHWPGGVAVGPGGECWVTESWAHRLVAVPAAGGRPRAIVKNFAGYPARIEADGSGGFWVAFLGMRTQLIEFVLREREFCDDMIARVPRELWIGPSLGGHFDYREPTQIGRIKKLGIQKPWAPPRSYGLVARLDAQGEAMESLHSRVDGLLHGVTSVRCFGARVLAAVQGRDRLVELPATQEVQ